MKISFKQNMGRMDRCFRVCIGMVLLGLGTLVTKGTIGLILLVLSIPLLVSGTIGFCPSYLLFGISTKHESGCC
ncbi:MAG: DUF2892 domain-containing protein [Nitrospirae bacterium]|nr:DUF2892 domain-containing protein [Nitrospirota bacterium]